jgi:enoyl-CoA hydratase/carnithine racemase
MTGSWHVFNFWTRIHGRQIHDSNTFCYKQRSRCYNYGIVVISVALNRPEKMNAMNNLMWEEIGAVFDRLARDPDCRAIVLRQGERVKSC